MNHFELAFAWVRVREGNWTGQVQITMQLFAADETEARAKAFRNLPTKYVYDELPVIASIEPMPPDYVSVSVQEVQEVEAVRKVDKAA